MLSMKNNNKDQEFQFYVLLSLALHLLVFLLFSFGLPSLFSKKAEPQIITFEMLPVTDVSNVKTQKIQQEKAEEQENARKIQKSQNKEQDKSDASKKTEHEENKEESKRDQDEKKPENQKDIVNIKEKDKKKTEDKKKSDKAQEKQVKSEKEKPKPKKKKLTDKDMDALLKTLEKASDGKEAKSNKRAVAPKSDAKESSQGNNFNEDNPLSISEEQAIRQQISRNWNVPAGVANAGEILITVYLALSFDGAVEQVKIVDVQCSAPGMVCKAAADSALRAVHQASPIQNLNPARYDSWKAFNITFDPREILGM